MYDTNYNSIKRCNLDCKKTGHCKLLVIRMDGGIVQVKGLNNAARIPVKETPEAASYDLVVAQATIYPAYSKMLVKTGLSIAMPPGCYVG